MSPYLPDVNVLIALLEPTHSHHEHLLSSGQITDSYLLRLAASHGAKLATLDRCIVTSAIAGGDGALLPIP